MAKIRCFKCKGRGVTGVAVSDLFIVMTGGLAALADTEEECDACDGKGWIRSE
jgi:hypothetical protein